MNLVPLHLIFSLPPTTDKPTVACVVGRWKFKLTRAVGHAGAMPGSGDKAEDKERWLMEAFGVDGLFTSQRPIVSAKGAVTTNIAGIPAALTAAMRLNGLKPDFEPRGSLSLKPWIANDQALPLPANLALPAVRALPPYDTQIEGLRKQIGAAFPRQVMKDCSGATLMDPKTQVTSVHNRSILDLSLQPLEASFALPLLREIADANERMLLDIALAAEINLVGDSALSAAEAAREAGNTPNTVMTAAAAIIGPKRAERTIACARALIDLFTGAGLQDARSQSFDMSRMEAGEAARSLFLAGAAEPADPRAEAMLQAACDRGARSIFLDYLKTLGGRPTRDAILAAISTTIAWGPLMRKRISAAEIDDHLNRGRDMDTRTPAGHCSFIA